MAVYGRSTFGRSKSGTAKFAASRGPAAKPVLGLRPPPNGQHSLLRKRAAVHGNATGRFALFQAGLSLRISAVSTASRSSRVP